MASGTVIRYDGKRGTVWRIKYADATGRQVMETVGAERDGGRGRRERGVAGQALGRAAEGVPAAEADDVPPVRQTWFAEGEKRRRWKPTTVAQYRSVHARLVETFGPMPLAAIRPRHVAEYVAGQSADPAHRR